MAKRASLAVWLVLAIAGCAGLYLVGNDRVPLWDRDEPWYAQCSRQMVQTGDLTVPRYLDRLRTEKPPLIYWLHVASIRTFGDNTFAPRFVSAMGMTATLTLLGIGLWLAVGPSRAVWTVFIFGTSGLTIAAGKMCLTDAVLLLWITGSQFCLYAIYRGRATWPVILTLGVAIGLGGLTKGPIMLAPLAATALALTIMEAFAWFKHRRPLRIRPAGVGRTFAASLTVAIIAVAIVGPWVYLVNKAEPRWLPAVFATASRHVTTPMEGHWGPPGYYLLLVWGTFFPWSLLLPTAAVFAWKHRKLPAIRFAIAAVLGPWIFQEFMKTKLPHYTLPAYPALAFLTADALIRCIRGQYTDLVKPVWIRATAAWGLLVAVIGSGTWVALAKFPTTDYAPMIALSLVGLAYGASVWLLFRAHRVAPAAVAMGLGMMLAIGLFYAWYLPGAKYLQLSPQAAQVLKQNGVTQPGQVITIDYVEPSMAWYQGGTLREEGDRKFLAQTPVDQWPQWIVLTRELLDTLDPQRQQALEILASFHGLAYADGGRVVELLVARKRELPQPSVATPY